MRVVIHQPEYFPCLALLGKIAQADTLVLLDDVQFNRASLQHRAWISNAAGKSRWMTIPFVHKFPQMIKDVEIADEKWGERHGRLLEEAYKDAPYYEQPSILAMTTKQVSLIASVSMTFLFQAFGLLPRIIHSSELVIDPELHKGDRVLAICKTLEATHYVSGKAGSTYLDRKAFEEAGVEVVVSKFEHPSSSYRDVEKPGRISGLDAVMWHYNPPSLLK